MFIDITGYVIELHGENGFKIKVTSDRVYSRKFSNLQVSKEVSIYISPDRYPSNNSSEFKLTEDKDQRDRINNLRSLSNALKMGDRVTCAVFIVERGIPNEVETYVINSRPKDIKTYAESDLWLFPCEGSLKRLEVDSRESLKARKQWFYTCLNREKCEEITGSEDNKYKDKPWINKHPIRTFPRIWGIRFRTAVSNLWKGFTRQENLLKVSIIANIILAFITAISVALNIWLLFFKNPYPSP